VQHFWAYPGEYINTPPYNLTELGDRSLGHLQGSYVKLSVSHVVCPPLKREVAVSIPAVGAFFLKGYHSNSFERTRDEQETGSQARGGKETQIQWGAIGYWDGRWFPSGGGDSVIGALRSVK